MRWFAPRRELPGSPWTLEQGSTNYGPKLTCCQFYTFLVNHSQAYLFIYNLWLFMLQWQNWVIMADTVWATEPEIFIHWPFTTTTKIARGADPEGREWMVTLPRWTALYLELIPTAGEDHFITYFYTMFCHFICLGVCSLSLNLWTLFQVGKLSWSREPSL